MDKMKSLLLPALLFLALSTGTGHSLHNDNLNLSALRSQSPSDGCFLRDPENASSCLICEESLTLTPADDQPAFTCFALTPALCSAKEYWDPHTHSCKGEINLILLSHFLTNSIISQRYMEIAACRTVKAAIHEGNAFLVPQVMSGSPRTSRSRHTVRLQT